MKNTGICSSRVPSALLAMLLAVCAAASPSALRATDDNKPPVAAKKSPWTPEDVVNQEDASQFEVSPDGRFAVWVKATSDKEKDERVSNLYLSNLSDGKPVQLTRGAYDISQPHWSPSGEMIAFLSSQPLPKPKPDDAHVQLWLLNSAGGAAWSLTQFERGIEQIAWLDDDTILFSAEEDPSLYERETKEHKDDSNVVDDTSHTAPVRIFKFSIKDQKERASPTTPTGF